MGQSVRLTPLTYHCSRCDGHAYKSEFEVSGLPRKQYACIKNERARNGRNTKQPIKKSRHADARLSTMHIAPSFL